MPTRIKSSQILDGSIVASDLHSAIAINTTATGTFGSLNSNGLLTVAGANILINDGSNNNERSVRLQNTTVTAYLGIEGTSANRFSGSTANNMFLGTTTEDGIQFATNNTVRATIDSSGDTSLLGALDVTGLSTLAGNLTLDSLNPMIDFSGDDSIIYRIAVDEANNRLTLGHSTNRSLYLSNTGHATFNYDVTIEGNLVVEGTTVTLNTADLNVEDKNITLNYHATADTSSTADGAGITIQDAVDASNNATILWDATNSTFDFSHGADFAAGINAPGVIVETSGGLDVRMGTDKRVIWQGNIGEIGNVAGFQATNTAGSANEAFGIRATDIRFATGNDERVRITDTGIAINKAGTNPSQAIDVTGNVRVHSGGYPYFEMGVSNSNYFRLVHDNPNDALVVQKASLTGNIMTFHGTTGTGVTVGDTSNHKDFSVHGEFRNTNNLPTIRPSLNFDFARTRALDPRIQFNRNSTATVRDGTKVKEQENLFTRTDNFSAGSWTSGSYTVTYNATTAPDGTNTGIKVAPNSIGQGTSIAITSNVGKTVDSYTWSMYVKADHSDYPALALYWNSSGGANVRFNITNGTVVSTSNGSGSISGSVVNCGNGWYRLISVYTGATSSAATFYVLDSTSNWNLANNPDGVKGIFVWGPQVEKRGFATTHTPNTTGYPIRKHNSKIVSVAKQIPRFDVDPATDESKGLLVERYSTNLATNSNLISATSAGYYENGIAPDGTACRVHVPDNGNPASSELYYVAYSTSYVAGTRYTMSVFQKALGTATEYIHYCNSTGFGPYATFQLTGDGTATIAGSNSSTSRAVIENCGNGWYRCSITATCATTGSWPYYVGLSSLGSVSPQPHKKAAVWGLQIEVGDEMTSYIPTDGSTVTRIQEEVKMLEHDFSSWYNHGEGTWFAHADAPSSDIHVAARIDTLHIESSNITSDYHLGPNAVGATNSIYAYIQNDGSQQAGLVNTLTPNAATLGYKFAFQYATNNMSMSVDGGVISSDSNCIPPEDIDRLFIGSRAGSSQHQNGRISKIAYYPRALGDDTLKALTED